MWVGKPNLETTRRLRVDQLKMTLYVKIFNYGADFHAFFLLFTASVQSQKPEPPLVPGVFSKKFIKIGSIMASTLYEAY